MFRNRNSQKPPDELIADFRAAFPSLSSSGRSANVAAGVQPGGLPTSTSLTDALDVAMPSRLHGEEHDIKDMDPTPRANIDPLRFTPSMLDPNSFAFSNFANQPPSYYMPTPGSTNTIFHPQAGDLHTPGGYTMGLGTPLSMPKSEPGAPAGQTAQVSLAGFEPQHMAPHIFQHQQSYYQDIQQSQQQSFAPHEFSQQQSVFESYREQRMDSKMPDYSVDVEMKEHQDLDPSSIDTPISKPLPQPENFRYHVTLNAPTAMIHHPDEIPVTYLNKGQAYSIAIRDTVGANTGAVVPTYRTFIRISFEDDLQRQRPAQCWQLWKEGRGTSEAHHRGGRLQAVEFVDPHHTGDMELTARPAIELESSSFDGFSVKWSPLPNSPPECAISVRFNFLSTDFSHSKGVKGIPVRLCAKTQLVTADMPMSPTVADFEICYCKVKLFRDHGAERKLANDVAHVKKSIEKLKAQVSKIESGAKDTTKKRRIEPSKASSSKPGKAQRHKRTWSMSSASDAGGKLAQPPEEDLQTKLLALEDMFTSTRPVSMLFLRGEEGDDPDLHPVHLTGEPATNNALHRTDTTESSSWDQGSSSIVSPTPSNHSRQSLERTDSAALRRKASFQQGVMGYEWAGQFHDGPARVQRTAHGGMLPEWIEAVGVDGAYRPPPVPAVRPVACFYVKPRVRGEQPADDYYRAVYVMQRSLAHLAGGIAAKAGLDPAKVLRTVRFNPAGLSILVDDESVAEMAEGQDMVAEFVPIDGVEGYELRLLF